MDRIFLTADARFYKAEKPTSKEDAEINNPSSDHFQHLTDEPVTISELHERIRLEAIIPSKVEEVKPEPEVDEFGD